MNFELLRHALPEWDEIRVIGCDVEQQGRISHIAGMTRQGNRMSLYVLEDAEPPALPGEEPPAGEKAAVPAMEGPVRENAALPGEEPPADEKAAVPAMEEPGREDGCAVSCEAAVERTARLSGEGLPGNRTAALPGEALPESRTAALSGEAPPEETAARIDMWEERHTNRKSFSHIDEHNYFDWVNAVIIGEQELAVESAGAASLGIPDNISNQLLFYELMKAGWSLPEDHPFRQRDWDRILLKEMVIKTPVTVLPDWDETKIRIRHGEKWEHNLLELPVHLGVGEKREIPFTLKDGREGICYINDVCVIDVWAEQEKQFSDPRYLEIMTEEELERHKQKFYQGLERDCPRGMCYPGVEYECTLDGNLTFYDSAWLDEEPPVHSGSVTIRLMTLKPDDPTGPHGLPARGCAIQTPVAPDVKELAVELFFYTERVPEREEPLSVRGSMSPR